MYKPGTLKLTWINPNDYTVLQSKMFNANDLKGALKESEGKPGFMLFELVKTSGDAYEWKLLPFGEAKRFVRSMKWNDSFLMPFVSIAIIGFAGYGIYKAIKR